MSSLFGSICLSDIPKEQIKKVTLKDGSTKMFLNIFIGERKEPSTFGERVYTHFVSCSPKQQERKEGVNYFIGDLETYTPKPSTPTVEAIENAPSVTEDDDMPF